MLAVFSPFFCCGHKSNLRLRFRSFFKSIRLATAKNTTFDKSRFFEERDSYYYFLLSSDMLENMVNLIYREGRG